MTAYIHRTPDSTFTGDKYTYSGWFKRGDLSARNNIIWGSSDGGSADFTEIEFQASGALHWGNKPNGGTNMQLITNRLFRDPAAWYHLVFAWDTTAAAADRARIYVNGVEETSFATDNNAGSGETGCSLATSGDEVDIGKQHGVTHYYYGEMSHLNLCMGTAYGPTDFGEFDSTSGIWKINPSPSVTHGTNGWQLKMEDRTNLDLDTSANAYTFTTSGDLTATYDNPSNNFATMNPLENYWQGSTYSNGNNTIVTVSGSNRFTPDLSNVGLSTGKWYMEMKLITLSGTNIAGVGIVSNQPLYQDRYIGVMADDWGYYSNTGDYKTNNANTGYGDTYGAGDIIGIALDLTNNKLYFSKNGVWQNSGVPTSGGTGTGAISITAVGSTPLREYFPSSGAFATANDYTWSMNFGNGYFGTTVAGTETDDAGIGLFKYDVPAGYYAICTTNLGDQS